MPCGFPGMGIPPLAPLKIGHQSLKVNIAGNSVDGEISNFILNGLNDFDIIEMSVNIILRRVRFRLVWNDVNMETDYKLLAELALMSGIKLDMGEKAKFQLKGLEIYGYIKYSLGLLGGGIRLTEMRIEVSLKEVNSDIEGFSKYKIVNRKINEIIEEWIMLAINDNTQKMGDLCDEFVRPVANNLIGDRTIGDIIGIITGGGGSSSASNDPNVKAECVPNLI